jgi:hypothetical protein
MNKHIYCLLLLAFGSLFSCQRDNLVSDLLSDEEVMAMIENSLLAIEGGITLHLEEAANTAATFATSDYCGTPVDSSMTLEGPTGRYLLKSNWTWQLNCSAAQLPNNMMFNLSGTSEYDGAQMDMDADLLGDLTVNNLLAGSHFIFNGALSREGETTLRLKAKSKEYFSTIKFSLKDIQFDKMDLVIDQGASAVNVYGTLDDGSTFDRDAKLTFNRDRTATLVLDNGTSILINL